MKRIFLLIFLIWPHFVFAQSNGGLGNIALQQAQNNVTVVYNSAGQATMMVLDAQNLSDPSWNPPGSRQVHIPVATYNAMKPIDLQAFISNNAPAAAVQSTP